MFAKILHKYDHLNIVVCPPLMTEKLRQAEFCILEIIELKFKEKEIKKYEKMWSTFDYSKSQVIIYIGEEKVTVAFS